MKSMMPVALFFLLPLTFLQADQVTLKNGTVYQGRILSETAYEVEVEVARNPAGTIRTLKIIQQEEVESMARNQAPVAVIEETAAPSAPAIEEEEEEPDLGQARSYLEKSAGLLEQGEYDRAIARFRSVANHPQLIEQSRGETDEARPALELRSQAYRLWMTALKGKADYLDEKCDQRTKQAKAQLDRAEERWDDYQDRVKEEKENSRNIIRMGSQKKTAAEIEEKTYRDALEKARHAKNENDAWVRRTTLEIQNLEAESDLLREQEKQIKDQLKKF